MAVGEKFAFLQFADSVIGTPDTAGVTLTIGGTTTGLPNTALRVINGGTATLWIGLGSRSTSSAAVTTKGLMIPPANNYGCVQVIRTGGALTVAAFTVGATQTTKIIITGGEGLAS